MLPLLLGGHFVVCGGVCPFFLLGALLGAFGGVGLAGGGRGDQGVEGEDEPECVGGTVVIC
jgi:hypothetical protein